MRARRTRSESDFVDEVTESLRKRSRAIKHRGGSISRDASMDRAVRIYADFQNSDIHGRVRLNTAGALTDLKALGVALSDQLPIVVYSEEFETDGRAQFSTDENIWVAQIDWKQLREL